MTEKTCENSVITCFFIFIQTRLFYGSDKSFLWLLHFQPLESAALSLFRWAHNMYRKSRQLRDLETLRPEMHAYDFYCAINSWACGSWSRISYGFCICLTFGFRLLKQQHQQLALYIFKHRCFCGSWRRKHVYMYT